MTLEKHDSICAKPSKDQKVRAYSVSTMGKLPQYKSPRTYMGSMELRARMNIMGICTTQDAMAEAAGWYMPSLTSFLSESHCRRGG